MLNVPALRLQFPALQRQIDGRRPIFLDGPGGTQVPQRVIDAIADYLSRCNSNHGGVFTTSRESDRILHEAHVAVADLLNAPSPDEIVFGQNMTSLTLHLSRAFALTLKPGDRVLVTRLDHDANVNPWVLAARDAGAEAVFVEIHTEDCTLDFADLRSKLTPRTRLVAVTCASNAVGTLNDARSIARLAHDAGALVYFDAVHYAPHGPIDVQAWDADFLACSTYKFFGPHVGILWGRKDLLSRLPAYKVRPAPDTLPDRWMTGTQNHEGLAGVAAAVDYLATLDGVNEFDARFPTMAGRRLRLHANLAAVQAYESGLARHLMAGLAQRPRFKTWGITQPDRLPQRVPTFSITDNKRTPLELAEHLASHQIYAWNGNFYALGLSEALGLEERGGFLRLGLVHYNTVSEIERLWEVLDAA
jgi:cysteine desulfurase family protein (TIGR01976 family)